MSLIRCPECGKEISDKAAACPQCGCPASEFKKIERNAETGNPRLLPEEEWPDMFECYHCGRKIPRGSDACPFCNYRYGIRTELNAAESRQSDFSESSMLRGYENEYSAAREKSDNKNTIISSLIAAIAIVAVIAWYCIMVYTDKNQSNKNKDSTSSAFLQTENIPETEKRLEVSTTKQNETEAGESTFFFEEYGYFLGSDYYFITNEDLNKYCPNMAGVNVYVVTEVDDMKDGAIQSTLEDGLMMSNFYVGEKFAEYQEKISEGDTVAIFGTVSGQKSYGFMGKSVELKDCQVFAIGKVAKAYRYDASSSRLSQYLTTVIETEGVSESQEAVNELPETESEEQKVVSEAPKPKTVTWQEKLQADLKSILPENIADKAYDILVNQIGFTEVEYLDVNEIGGSNYDFDSAEYKFTLTASDDVYRVFQPGGGGVFYEDGTVKMTISDIERTKIDSASRSTYYSMAKEIVKSCLMSPSTADFPTLLFSSSDILMQRKDNVVGVQSYVDSQNALGATVRSEWLVEFEVVDKDNFLYNPIYIKVGNDVAGEFIDLN